MTVYNYEEAAIALNIPQSWIEKNHHRFPRLQFGKYVRFEDQDLTVIKAMHRVDPTAERAEQAPAPVSLLDLKPGRAPRARKSA
jgi:hypothetical protein